jgi:hypothetical protein
VLAAFAVCGLVIVAAWVRARRTRRSPETHLVVVPDGSPQLGAMATVKAIQRMIELCPDCTVIAVVDRDQRMIGAIVVSEVRDILEELVDVSAVIAADLMASCADRRIMQPRV